MDEGAHTDKELYQETLAELRKTAASLDETRWLNEDMPVDPDRLMASAGL